jgi:ferredoxin-NADP reductase
VRSYPALVEAGNVFIQLEELNQTPKVVSKRIPRPIEAELTLLEIIEETPDVRTFRFDNSTAKLPFDNPGQFVKICVNHEGENIWRSFTISSSPHRTETIDLTIKRNPLGIVSNALFNLALPGSRFKIKGAQGNFCFDPDLHKEPLVLVSAGSGITPMMAIARFLSAEGFEIPCTFLHGARTSADIIFYEECLELTRNHSWFQYVPCLSQPSETWEGLSGRLSLDHLRQSLKELTGQRFFLCGPNDFMDSLRAGLIEAGVPAACIQTEQFHATKSPVTT